MQRRLAFLRSSSESAAMAARTRSSSSKASRSMRGTQRSAGISSKPASAASHAAGEYHVGEGEGWVGAWADAEAAGEGPAGLALGAGVQPYIINLAATIHAVTTSAGCYRFQRLCTRKPCKAKTEKI